MSNTRKAIRQEAAARFDGRYLTLVATGGTTTTVVDTTRQDSGGSTSEYVGGWLLPTSGNGAGVTKPIASWAPTTGTWTQAGTAWAGVIAAADEVELHMLLDPRDWNDCINRGLRRCTLLRRDALTLVSQQLQYALTSQTTLESPKHVVRILMRDGATSAQYTYRELEPSRWWVDDDDDVLTLNLRSAIEPQSNLAMYIEYIGAYSAISTDAATTTCPLDWAVSAAIMVAWERFGKQIDERSVPSLQSRLETSKAFMEQCAIWAPKLARAVTFNDGF